MTASQSAVISAGLQLGYTVIFGSYASFLFIRTGRWYRINCSVNIIGYVICFISLSILQNCIAVHLALAHWQYNACIIFKYKQYLRWLLVTVCSRMWWSSCWGEALINVSAAMPLTPWEALSSTWLYCFSFFCCFFYPFPSKHHWMLRVFWSKRKRVSYSV